MPYSKSNPVTITFQSLGRTHVSNVVYIQETGEMLNWKQTRVVFLLENYPKNLGILQNLLVLLI